MTEMSILRETPEYVLECFVLSFLRPEGPAGFVNTLLIGKHLFIPLGKPFTSNQSSLANV